MLNTIVIHSLAAYSFLYLALKQLYRALRWTLRCHFLSTAHLPVT
ncbi:hypothetical protein Hsw_2458 [Hymenobacter swuensis DY53]|uniref:Uncharacterized protein n=1 Tax=Hymenobacter swuensis DY53 TaxID=1227739 RepID=W8EZI9_9BACT|nr:hypothetical protein Hsw_2458 [Hymenobacter swuensis DY53]